jgi:hypothetical protein
MASNTLTSRNHKITLTVNSIQIPGDWKTFSGGGLSTESTFNNPGGMAEQEALGGIPTRENVSIGREYNWVRDDSLVGPGGFLDEAAKNDADTVVTVQRLNRLKQPVGRAKMYAGKIVQVGDAELDSEDSEAQMWTVECSAVA